MVDIPDPGPDGTAKPPLQLIATTEVDGTEFSYFVNICDHFDVHLNEEHFTYQWVEFGDLPDGPLIPGLLEVINSPPVVALRLKRMHELDVAKAMVRGALPSPQKFANMTFFKVRITGTGAALRRGTPEEKDEKGNVTKAATQDEHVFRDPKIYLTDDFLERCKGLPLIYDHPKKRVLTSKEFNDRIVGIVVCPYIQGTEVWGIARVYDDATATILSHEKMSTSPSVVFHDRTANDTFSLSDGSTLLVEGNPSLLDHLAICEIGVWDKGMEASGVISETVAEA
jgi:hypothetical protein